MPNRRVHIVAGALAGAGFSIATSTEQTDGARILEGLGGILGGTVASPLPDFLEPGRLPSHRGFAHSITAGGLVITLAKEHLPSWQAHFRQWADSFSEERASCQPGSPSVLLYALAEGICRFLAGLVAGLIAGYGSHLLLDSLTPYGLRLV